jgi:hypothetical protein
MTVGNYGSGPYEEMTTMIAGHKLSNAERRILDAVIDYMRDHAGDSGWGPHTSPTGDGRFVPISEIFPERSATGSANRRTARRLSRLGVLSACEIIYRDDAFQGRPYHLRSLRS